ncbi:uncharacterized protein LOC116848411 isoform X2 [Odontomachus brunneus]|uniref:uncharacterized protein LOC116848411 isoform X2 n=1 Tax=Odontomachus brunneus TaxID=486640 RepID=UPI0013F1C972|nr:uncharacterized protein LOC116848411 isoform X2 [Odontomachus brunneus]
MTAFNRLLIAFCLIHFIIFVNAIYDPRATTTKPSERREAILSWHSASKENETTIQTEPSRVQPWQTHTDILSEPPIGSWSPWRKNPASEIEQRTQVNTQDYPPGSQVPERQRPSELDQWEQQESLKPPLRQEESVDSDKNRGGFPIDSKYGNRRPSQNMIDFENKPRYDDGKETPVELEDDDVYEGVPIDSTKPRKENILLSRKPQHTVAWYDPQFGVQCPDHNATGQFVYPPDCKFFVNCWKGRAFVQPCAPGTHFNPDTLECDFPHKVRCYESEPAYYRKLVYSESQVDQHSQKLQEPKCPPYITGLLRHHGDCTKFLQCTNGATYVMDCGPGTVFNPAISVCDWPRNVKGCEDTFKSEEDVKVPQTPPNLQTYPYAHDKLKYTEGKRIACPADFTGLLPHPETCKKFLQCANGATFVMDCGPGTAFNPLTTVCDWPHKVPSCKTEKPADAAHRTTSNTRLPSGGWSTWSNSSLYNHTSGSRGHRSWPWSTTTTTTFRPTWRPFTTTPDPRWVPSWTTARPPYDRHEHAANHYDRYGSVHEDSQYRDYGPYRPGWQPSGGNFGRPADYGYHDRYDGQWTENPSADRNPHGTRHFNPRPGQWWPAGHRYPPSDRYGHDYGSPSRHYHHHHHSHVPPPRPPVNPSWDSGSVSGSTDGSYDRGVYGEYIPQIGRWPSDSQHHPPHPHDYHHFDHTVAPSETDQRQFPVYFPAGKHEEDDIRYHDNARDRTKFGADGNLPANRGSGYDFSSSRRDYDRTSPGSHPPGFNRTSPSAGNVFLNSGDQFAENWNQTRHGPRRDGPTTPWPGQGNTAWSRPDESGSQPSTWRGQQDRGQVQTDTLTRPWDQDEPPFPVYYVPSVRPLTHSQKTALPTPISGQMIRLRGGAGPHGGYVEVQGVLPGWGIVCDSRNSWTLKEANVVCRQLGYIKGAEMAWQGRNNRNGVPTWIAANTVTCLGNETRFQSCKFTHNRQCRVDRDAIGVRCVSNRIAHCRKDEIPHEGQCYHLAGPDRGPTHAEASDYCKRRNARLIDITNQAENNFVSEWLSQSYPEVNSIITSGLGFTTMNVPLWLWEDSSHAKFKFTKWWPGWMNDTKPPTLGSRPLCIVMKRKFPCHELAESTCVADYFFWDTEDCETSSRGHSFVCKKPYDDIGCVYGKGNQYTGKANVTLSGNECLPWADQRIAHQLRVNIVNEQVREKLKTHNFCRNPNPEKESRPWCFADPTRQREYCDIPACGNIDPKQATLSGQCKPKHFECMPGECIPSPWVCDGEEDCTNGADERKCAVDLSLFEKSAKHKLEGYDVEKWLNTPLKTCALRCKNADFTCRSFNHKADGNICLLSDSNIGLTGALKSDRQFDYYEMTERSVNCDGMFTCNNHKCINQSQVCNGKNDCNDRSDESICTVENLDYDIRLAGTNNSHEGRVEVKVLGHWGQVCDDNFGMINADVICKELGFVLGALEVRPGGFYGNLEPPTRFMVDQLKCRGNETTLRECDFNGWGVHNCQPEEAVGIVCKTAINTCQQDYWKCDNSPTCISASFLCDEVVDCPDRSDESPEHCDAPFELRLVDGNGSLQGRVEVRHHGVWGTVCDDDFTSTAAAVICRSLGYGGKAIAKKNGFFGPGEGPIWLDEVFCHGNETQLYRCDHNHWGRHNCNHNEDAGVICSPGDVNDTEQTMVPELPDRNIDEILPANCGQRAKDFNDDEDLIFAKVVHGSIASKGTYPWQASIRVRGHSRSSHWCGAVVVSPLHVLTAAHCLEGYNKGTYFVRAGDYNTDIDEGTEVEANIEDYYVHEQFRIGHRMNNDIALVLLKGPGIPLGKDIMPICLPPENTEYPAGLNCTISGFGSIETGKTTQSKDLRYGWVPLLDQSICRAGYVYGEGAISDGMMCAGYLDEGIDTCDGDSGGPLACHHNGAFTLYGITSWGQHCGKANKPGVYVRVAYYRQWIDQKIKESLAGR